MSQPFGDKPTTRKNLLETMRQMRSLVDTEDPSPVAEAVDWSIPHRFRQEAIDSLTLFASKLTGHLENTVAVLSGQPFKLTVEGVREQYAEWLYDQVILEHPKTYYLPLTQTGKGHIGFISLPIETAAILVGCMLRDPETQISRDGQMSSLAESILMDAAAAIAEAIDKGFSEHGKTGIEKTERLVYGDWPVRFHNLEDLCRFEFKAACGKTELSITLTLLDEIIADIAQIDGPFGRIEDKKDNSDRIAKRMYEAPMSVTALLSSSLMTLNDILTLEEGDVVMLDRKVTEPIDVKINGQSCFCAWPAAHAGRRALLVADEKNRLA